MVLHDPGVETLAERQAVFREEMIVADVELERQLIGVLIEQGDAEERAVDDFLALGVNCEQQLVGGEAERDRLADLRERREALQLVAAAAARDGEVAGDEVRDAAGERERDDGAPSDRAVRERGDDGIGNGEEVDRRVDRVELDDLRDGVAVRARGAEHHQVVDEDHGHAANRDARRGRGGGVHGRQFAAEIFVERRRGDDRNAVRAEEAERAHPLGGRIVDHDLRRTDLLHAQDACADRHEHGDPCGQNAA